MRRLPVYFLLDISDSMVGEPVSEVQKGLEGIVCELRNDPYALETVFVSVLGFAGKAVELEPLTEICLFNPPDLPIGSGTSLGAGLELLMACIERDVQKTTAEKKGDWKPLIFLFTDGAPTDDPQKAINRWNSRYRRGANLVAITFGDNADAALLGQFADNVLTLRDLSPESFREFFRWVSASLKVSSMAVAEQGKDGCHLPEYSINLEKAEIKDKIDENFAILPLRCTTGRAFWLAKYARGGQGKWRYVGAYPVNEESYGALGAGGTAGNIDLADVDLAPVCPVCRKSVGVYRCGSCGRLACWNEQPNPSCPWCGESLGEIREVVSLEAVRSRG